MDNFYRISIKGLVFNNKGEFLLCKENVCKWELPGGGIDYGEDYENCLRRELKEEMGIDILKINPKPVCFFTWLEDNKHRANIVYEIELKSLEFTPSDECVEIGFFSIEDALKLDLFPNVEKFIKEFLNK